MPLFLVRAIAFLPLLALLGTAILFLRHRKKAGTVHRVGALRYFATVIAAGLIGYEVAKYLGILAACMLPEEPGNLCGLVGWLVTGPLGAAVAMVGVGLFLLRESRVAPRR